MSNIIKTIFLTAVVAIGVAGTFVVFAAPGLANMAYAGQGNGASGSTSFNELAAAGGEYGGPPYMGVVHC